jgi:hypothetical protein
MQNMFKIQTICTLITTIALIYSIVEDSYHSSAMQSNDVQSSDRQQYYCMTTLRHKNETVELQKQCNYNTAVRNVIPCFQLFATTVRKEKDAN